MGKSLTRTESTLIMIIIVMVMIICGICDSGKEDGSSFRDEYTISSKPVD